MGVSGKFVGAGVLGQHVMQLIGAQCIDHASVIKAATDRVKLCEEELADAACEEDAREKGWLDDVKANLQDIQAEVLLHGSLFALQTPILHRQVTPQASKHDMMPTIPHAAHDVLPGYEIAQRPLMPSAPQSTICYQPGSKQKLSHHRHMI